jgi:hypothetical protein
VARRAHRWGVPHRDRAARDGWLIEPDHSVCVGSDVGGEQFGSFLVPVRTPGGRPAVVTRTRVRSGTGGNGWSTSYTPE